MVKVKNLLVTFFISSLLACNFNMALAKESQGFCAVADEELDQGILIQSKLAQSRTLAKPKDLRNLKASLANLNNNIESTPLNGIFHTNPGASKVVQIIYKVDQPIEAFDGKGTMESFDRDGNPFSLSQGEWSIIKTIAACVAEKYSPYDVDFTNDTSIQADYIQYLGGTSSDGSIRGVASFSQPIGFNFANEQTISLDAVRDPNYSNYVRAEVWCSVLAHELGHNLSLRHHALNSEEGTHNNYLGSILNSSRSYRYDPGTVVYQPIMGSGLLANTPLIFYNNYSNLLTKQDDIAIIGEKLGLRADDFGDNINSASRMNFVRNFASIDGILGARQVVPNFPIFESDKDYFYFDIPAGRNYNLNFDLSRPVEYRGGLYAAMMTLYNSRGNQIKQVKSHERFDALNMNLNLAPGRYYLSVTNDEVNGACGAYHLKARMSGNFAAKVELNFDGKNYTEAEVIDLGQARAGISQQKTIQLKNMGSRDLTVYSVDGSKLPKGIKLLDSITNRRLSPGASLNLRFDLDLSQMDPELIGDLIISSTDRSLRTVKLRAELYSNVIWLNAANLSFASGSPAKTGASGWNAGASSREVLAPGHDGWFEVKVDRVDHDEVFGFSNIDQSPGFDDLMYAVYLKKRFINNIFQYQIIEDFPKMEFYRKSREGFNNLSRNASTRDGVVVRQTSFIPNIQDYKVGDVIRVERSGSKMMFKRNGLTVTEWDVNPNESLVADMSLFDAGAVFSEPKISFDADPEAKDYNPSNNSTNVPSLNPELKLGFSESIKLGSSGFVSVVRASDGATINRFNARSPGGRLLINPKLNSELIIKASNLQSGVEYYVTLDYGAVTDLRGNAFEGFNDSRRWRFKTATRVTHQNPQNRYDTNADGIVSSTDALIVINMINNGGSGTLPEFEHVYGSSGNVVYPDINGDGILSPNDSLNIINYINNGGNNLDQGEGEGPSASNFSWQADPSSASHFTVSGNTIRANPIRRWSQATGSEQFRLSQLSSGMSFETEIKDAQGYRYLVLSNNDNYWRSSRSSRFGFYLGGSFRSGNASSYLYVLDGGSFRRVGTYRVGDKLKLTVDKAGRAKVYKNNSLVYTCARRLPSSNDYRLNLAVYTRYASQIYNLQWQQ